MASTEIYIVNRRRNTDGIREEYPGYFIVDVTSKGILPWRKFSPFYPHGNIPVPFSPGVVGKSVEGIWQALKVFEHSDIDLSKLDISDMKGIKRTCRKFGRVLGHRKGIGGDVLLGYLDARLEIYIPCYQFILDNYLQEEIELLRQSISKEGIVLLDYEINLNIEDLSMPLSHASLIANYLKGRLGSGSRN